LTLGNFVGGTLPPAYLCGTEIVVEAADVRPVFGDLDRPEFLNDPDFQGITFAKLGVSIPSEYLELDPGSSLTIEMTNAAIGNTGFTGAVAVAADATHPVTGTFLGFPFRFRELRINMVQNAILEATFVCDLRFKALEDGDEEKWLGVDLSFSGDGDLSGTLSAVQPPEAEGTPEALATAEFAGVATFDLTSLRITRVDTLWSCWFSGALQLQIPGAACYRRKAHVVERQKSWSSCSRPANVLFKLKCAPVPIRQVKHALSDTGENSGEKQWLLKGHCKLNA
jgi:hypothetical protein